MSTVVPLGHNNPPSPFDDAKASILSLEEEARHWLDGAEVSSQAEADAIAKLLDMARKAKKEADTARKKEAKPFDDGKKEIQTRYKPLLEQCDRIADVCKKANQPWLIKLEELRRREEAAARAKAEEEARKAREALEAARASDLAAREEAERQVQFAKDAERAARQASKQTASAKGGARAMTLRTVYRPEITNATEFARWCWQYEKQPLLDCLDAIAKRRVANKFRDMPGVVIHEDKVPV
ncbi:hypothetical protein [Roseibium sp. RKSG952]|uniref:hypothetical protein n=1 Tax=Roseibium sp. RKSG952 TaxID=2529384 RepID=UPI0012BB72D0|nr:hypothetical protein [Roseibium sp. RKSG952]MTH96545.1 hypothetical protein [Roseibium sp. RKSG952]